MRKVRLKDVAEACGVSTATVSRAMNGLSPEDNRTTAMIRQTAAQMGYVPNAAALTLRTNRSYNIGVLYESQMNHEYFSALLDDLRREARKLGYDLTLIGGDEGTGRQVNYLEHARRRNLDGVVVIQADFESAEVMRLAASSVPSVVIDHLYEGCDCVCNDNRASMSQIVRYVRSMGHKRIALIAGQQGAVTRERLAGFYKACAELGICVPEGYVREGHFHDPQECTELIKELTAGPEGATCVLCPDDYSCLGALWQLKREGISVPEQVSLVGYDGIEMGRMIPPVLTTYRQDTAGIAAETVALLNEAVTEPETHRSRQITVKGRLVEGETVGSPRK